MKKLEHYSFKNNKRIVLIRCAIKESHQLFIIEFSYLKKLTSIN